MSVGIHYVCRTCSKWIVESIEWTVGGNAILKADAGSDHRTKPEKRRLNVLMAINGSGVRRDREMRHVNIILNKAWSDLICQPPSKTIFYAANDASVRRRPSIMA
jgi:hypothetical protein